VLGRIDRGRVNLGSHLVDRTFTLRQHVDNLRSSTGGESLAHLGEGTEECIQSCRWPSPTAGTRGDVGRSAATRRPSCWLTSTARTDDGEVTMKRKEYEFYAKAENQRPQGPARRRKPRLTEMVPVRFPEETLTEVQRRAEADDRSVSAWIRRAVEQELKRTAS